MMQRPRTHWHLIHPEWWGWVLIVAGGLLLASCGKPTPATPVSTATPATTVAPAITATPTVLPPTETATPPALDCRSMVTATTTTTFAITPTSLQLNGTAIKVIEVIGAPFPLRWFIGLGTGTSEDQLPTELSVVDDFNASSVRSVDKIFVYMEVIRHSFARETLLTEIAAGNGPDVIGPLTWSDANALPADSWLDLTPIIRDEHYDTGQIDAPLWEMSRNRQGLVGMPFVLYPGALEWNTALFAQAGLQHPPVHAGQSYTLPDGSQVDWDWQTLAQVARLLTIDSNGRNATQPEFDAAHIVQHGFSWGHETNPALTASFWQADSLLAPGGSPGHYTALIPAAWRASWQWSYDGLQGSQPFISTDPGSFETGKTAMTIETTRYFNSFGKIKTFQFAALPAYDGQPSRRLDMETFRMWKNGRHSPEAFRIIRYLLNPGVYKLMMECNGLPPAYDALPAQRSDRQSVIAFRKRQFPWVTTWDALTAGLENPQTPADEGNLPNFTQVWERLAAFGARLEGSQALDLAEEEALLESDLTVLFNQ